MRIVYGTTHLVNDLLGFAGRGGTPAYIHSIFHSCWDTLYIFEASFIKNEMTLFFYNFEFALLQFSKCSLIPSEVVYKTQL